MNYAYILDSGDIVGPVGMRSQFNGVGGWQLLTDEQRLEHRWYPCEVIGLLFDPMRQNRSELPMLVLDDERLVVTATYQINDKSVDTVYKEQVAALEVYRFNVEVGGAQVPGGGLVLTSREQVGLLNSVFSTLQVGFIKNIDWKAPAGWVSATIEDITPLALVAALHVQACFSAERYVDELLAAVMASDEPTVDALLAIDIRAEFDAKRAALYEEGLARAAATQAPSQEQVPESPAAEATDATVVADGESQAEAPPAAE